MANKIECYIFGILLQLIELKPNHSCFKWYFEHPPFRQVQKTKVLPEFTTKNYTRFPKPREKRKENAGKY